MARIAVENNLNHVKEALQNSGHEVVDMTGNLDNCDCCVISGVDKDVMGIADRVASGSVINAQGMTAEEIVRRVDESVQKQV